MAVLFCFVFFLFHIADGCDGDGWVGKGGEDRVGGGELAALSF